MRHAAKPAAADIVLNFSPARLGFVKVTRSLLCSPFRMVGCCLLPRLRAIKSKMSFAVERVVVHVERSYADLEAELDAILAEDEDADVAPSQEDEDAASSSQDEDDTAQASSLPSPPLPSAPLLAMDANVPPPPLPPLPPIDYESEAHRQLLEHCKQLDEAEPPRSPLQRGGERCPAAEREAAQVEAARQAAEKRAAA